MDKIIILQIYCHIQKVTGNAIIWRPSQSYAAPAGCIHPNQIFLGYTNATEALP